ncbi:MAG: hypothetical protein M3416_11205, partial [Acidobacteriota bacterium]|nr:hypothetical protein [Acidobacteriota bacterium]
RLRRPGWRRWWRRLRRADGGQLRPGDVADDDGGAGRGEDGGRPRVRPPRLPVSASVSFRRGRPR